MCGIAGAIALNSASGRLSDPLEHNVDRMALRLTHRGPDGSGVWKAPSERIALAHRRLAIIDFTAIGRQPMDYAGRFWITFNGEIYNFRELLVQLQGLGHAFRAIPGFDGRTSEKAAGSYLRDGRLPGALSIYEGIYKLPPGHCYVPCRPQPEAARPLATARRRIEPPSELRPRAYSSCRDAATRGRKSLITDQGATIDQGRELLGQAVRDQIHADVPTGAFLSGGVGSIGRLAIRARGAVSSGASITQDTGL